MGRGGGGRIRQALQSIGAPVDARGLGVEDQCIIQALLRAKDVRPERYTILGEGLTKKAAQELAKVTMVIE